MEAHACAATAYVCGPLNASVAARAILACRALPRRVRACSRRPARRTVCDVDALVMLEALLLEWSSERRGVTSDRVSAASRPVTRSLHFRARSETRPTHSYDQSVMIEWS